MLTLIEGLLHTFFLYAEIVTLSYNSRIAAILQAYRQAHHL